MLTEAAHHAQVQRAAVHEVHHAPGRAHSHVDAAAQLPNLLPDVRACMVLNTGKVSRSKEPSLFATRQHEAPIWAAAVASAWQRLVPGKMPQTHAAPKRCNLSPCNLWS